jgi:hypothetical protein
MFGNATIFGLYGRRFGADRIIQCLALLLAQLSTLAMYSAQAAHPSKESRIRFKLHISLALRSFLHVFDARAQAAKHMPSTLIFHVLPKIFPTALLALLGHRTCPSFPPGPGATITDLTPRANARHSEKASLTHCDQRKKSRQETMRSPLTADLQIRHAAVTFRRARSWVEPKVSYRMPLEAPYIHRRGTSGQAWLRPVK